MIRLGLEDARVVVFGAGYVVGRAGLGWTTAMRLADAGARVVCVDHDERRAQEAAEAILARGGRAFALVADVTDEEQVVTAFERAVAELGGLDIVVDIVGRAHWSQTVETSLTQWNDTLATNLTQAFLVFRTAMPYLVAQGTGGSLVALSSVDGMHAAPFHGAYGAAKAGLIQLAQTMSDEFGRYGIRVNTVAPGNVGFDDRGAQETPWGANPHNPLAPPRPADIANAVLFLASDLAQRITGQTLVVDGGALAMSRWGHDPRRVPRRHPSGVDPTGGQI